MPPPRDDKPPSPASRIIVPASGPPSSNNRRASERHAITLRVDYKRMNTFFADYAKNISKGGTFIRTGKPLDVGTEFVFVLSIPGQTDQLQLLGQVMWAVDETKATEEQPAGMGIRFKFRDEAELKELEDFVARMMSENLGSHVTERLLKDPK